MSWVEWILNQPKGQYFVEIDTDYLNNIFNYYGLKQKITYFKQSYDLIRGPYLKLENRPKTWPENIDDYGLCLYGILHSRYILTEFGLEKMKIKFLNKKFFPCPRTLCNGIQCLPYGNDFDIGQSNIKLFCPHCSNIYHFPNNFYLDGSFFGSTYVHIFIKKYSNLLLNKPFEKYIPKIFGFKICNEKISDTEEDL